MARVLELSDQGFNTTMMNTKGSNRQSNQHARTDGQYKQRDGNSKKEPKRNVTDQNHCNRNEEYL